MQTRNTSPSNGAPHKQAGFSLIEVLVAAVVLMVGVIAVAQLVPTAIDFDLRNRYDSTALIVAQRQLEQMTRQSLVVQANPALPDYNFTDTDGTVCYVGASPSPATAPANQPPPAPAQTGCPVASGLLNFTQPCTAGGYFKTVAVGASTYSVRWNVITEYGNDQGTIRPVTKRITLSARAVGPVLLAPTTLSVLVSP